MDLDLDLGSNFYFYFFYSYATKRNQNIGEFLVLYLPLNNRNDLVWSGLDPVCHRHYRFNSEVFY